MVENYRTDRGAQEHSPLLTRRHSLQPSNVQGAVQDVWQVPSEIKRRSRLSLGSRSSFHQTVPNASRKSPQGGTPASRVPAQNGKMDHYKPDNDFKVEEYDIKKTVSWASTTHGQHRSASGPGNSIGYASMEAQAPLVEPTGQEFEAETRKLVAMQRTVTALRLEVQERRKALQYLRDKVADADRRFMDVLRVSWTTGGIEDHDKLEPLYNICVQARDDVGMVVDDYEKLELRLSSEEFKLTESLSETLNGHHSHENRTARHDPANPDETIFSYSSSSDDQESIDPRNSSTLHGVHLGEHLSVGQQPQLKNAAPRADVPGSLEVLSLQVVERRSAAFAGDNKMNSDTKDGSTKVPIEISAPDLLVQSAWNPLDLDTPSLAFTDSDPPSDEIDLDRVSDGMEWSFHGSELLFRRAMTKDVDDSIFEPEFLNSSKYLQKFENAHNRIDRWLLHQLRLSVREIFQLRDQLVHKYAKFSRESDGWPELALKLWETDPHSYDETSPLRNMQKSISSKEDRYTGYAERQTNPVPVVPNPIVRHDRPHTDNEYYDPMARSSREGISAKLSSDSSLFKISHIKGSRGGYRDQASLPLRPWPRDI